MAAPTTAVPIAAYTAVIHLVNEQLVQPDAKKGKSSPRVGGSSREEQEGGPGGTGGTKQQEDPAREMEKKTQAEVEEAVPTEMPPPVTPSPEVQEEMKEASKSAAEMTGMKIDKPG